MPKGQHQQQPHCQSSCLFQPLFRQSTAFLFHYQNSHQPIGASDLDVQEVDLKLMIFLVDKKHKRPHAVEQGSFQVLLESHFQ